MPKFAEDASQVISRSRELRTQIIIGSYSESREDFEKRTKFYWVLDPFTLHKALPTNQIMIMHFQKKDQKPCLVFCGVYKAIITFKQNMKCFVNLPDQLYFKKQSISLVNILMVKHFPETRNSKCQSDNTFQGGLSEEPEIAIFREPFVPQVFQAHLSVKHREAAKRYWHHNSRSAAVSFANDIQGEGIFQSVMKLQNQE